MWHFIILQLVFSNILFRYFPTNTSLDIYRSYNCLLLTCRGINFLLNQPEDSVTYTTNTCFLYISYNTLDLYYLVYIKIKRLELIFHHIFTIIAYTQLYCTKNLLYESFLAHIFLLAELLSIFNWLLRGHVLLKYWRIIIITTVRIPIWLYMITTNHLLKHTFSRVLTIFAGGFMPLLDIYFIHKLFPK